MATGKRQPSATRAKNMRGKRNAALPEGQGGRLRIDLSISGKRRAFFEQMTRGQGKIATDQEIIDTARTWYYGQDEKARREEKS